LSDPSTSKWHICWRGSHPGGLSFRVRTREISSALDWHRTGGRSFAAAQDDGTNGRLPTGQSDVDNPLSAPTRIKCQVGSLPAPCHPLPRGRPRSRRISLRSTVSGQGRFLAAARNDNERWWLSHHSTGHITLVGALSGASTAICPAGGVSFLCHPAWCVNADPPDRQYPSVPVILNRSEGSPPRCRARTQERFFAGRTRNVDCRPHPSATERSVRGRQVNLPRP